MLFCLVIENHWDLSLSILIAHEVVLYDVILPDINELLKYSLRVVNLSRKLKQMSQMEVALAEEDALWAMLNALLIDTSS